MNGCSTATLCSNNARVAHRNNIVIRADPFKVNGDTNRCTIDFRRRRGAELNFIAYGNNERSLGSNGYLVDLTLYRDIKLNDYATAFGGDCDFGIPYVIPRNHAVIDGNIVIVRFPHEIDTRYRFSVLRSSCGNNSRFFTWEQDDGESRIALECRRHESWCEPLRCLILSGIIPYQNNMVNRCQDTTVDDSFNGTGDSTRINRSRRTIFTIFTRFALLALVTFRTLLALVTFRTLLTWCTVSASRASLAGFTLLTLRTLSAISTCRACRASGTSGALLALGACRTCRTGRTLRTGGALRACLPGRTTRTCRTRLTFASHQGQTEGQNSNYEVVHYLLPFYGIATTRNDEDTKLAYIASFPAN